MKKSDLVFTDYPLPESKSDTIERLKALKLTLLQYQARLTHDIDSLKSQINDFNGGSNES